MDITQTFYNNLAPQYDKLFLDWNTATQEQAIILDKLFRDNGFSKNATVLDCACGIGTQTIGIASLGYNVTASDISDGALEEAKKKSKEYNISFAKADFRALSDVFSEHFDIIIAMDNALPHMLSNQDLHCAIKSIVGQLKEGGLFIASIRDYDALLKDKPPYSPPYIHKTQNGQRVSFQTWQWNDDHYNLIQYIVEDDTDLKVSKFECTYRATRREELTKLLLQNGCSNVQWKFSDETGFYQPIVIARK